MSLQHNSTRAKYGRDAVEAFLKAVALCEPVDKIKCLIDGLPSATAKKDDAVLKAKDGFRRTALHIAVSKDSVW